MTIRKGRIGGNMKDTVDSIIKGGLKPKLSYYINPFCIKITVIILLLIFVFAMDSMVE